MLFKIMLCIAFSGFSFSQDSVDDLIDITDLGQLVENEASMAHFEQVQKKCQTEKKLNSFPYHCLLLLELQLNKREVSPQWKTDYEIFNRQCRAGVDSLEEVSKIEQLLQIIPISDHCRLALRERREDLRYMNGEKNGPNIEIIKGHETNHLKKSLL